MTDVSRQIGRAITVLALTLCSATLASAVPMDSGAISMDSSASGQITVNVYGDLAHGLMQGAIEQGRFSSAASAWDPLSLIGGAGTVDAMAVFGRETADVGDDFVRFWMTHGSPWTQQVWVMPSMASQDPLQQQPIAGVSMPEPASMLLFGTGLVGLAAAVRRHRGRRRERR